MNERRFMELRHELMVALDSLSPTPNAFGVGGEGWGEVVLRFMEDPCSQHDVTAREWCSLFAPKVVFKSSGPSGTGSARNLCAFVFSTATGRFRIARSYRQK